MLDEGSSELDALVGLEAARPIEKRIGAFQTRRRWQVFDVVYVDLIVVLTRCKLDDASPALVVAMLLFAVDRNHRLPWRLRAVVLFGFAEEVELAQQEQHLDALLPVRYRARATVINLPPFVLVLKERAGQNSVSGDRPNDERREGALALRSRKADLRIR